MERERRRVKSGGRKRNRKDRRRNVTEKSETKSKPREWMIKV